MMLSWKLFEEGISSRIWECILSKAAEYSSKVKAELITEFRNMNVCGALNQSTFDEVIGLKS